MSDRFPLELVPAEVADVARRLREAGHEAWYVGGAVRDRLHEAATGRKAARPGDFDIATSARPEQVQALFRRTVPVGIEHGTVAVLDKHNVAHEVTTFRKDVRTDGRHAEVAFGVSLEEDLARRDFTINAVAVHPESGELADPFGGRADLARGVVRAVGDAATRFREDRLRVLRGLRFAAALAFEVEPATWEALRASAHELAHLSRERVRDEWLKTLATSAPSAGVGLWRRAGVLDQVWPELAALEPGADAALDAVEGREPVLVTALALHLAGNDPRSAEAALTRLRFSNQDVARVSDLVAALGRPLPEPEGEPLRRWLSDLQSTADHVLAVVQPADLRASLVNGATAVRASGAPLSLKDLAVTGTDLIAAGIPAGPDLGRTLRRLLDAALKDPSLNTRDRLLALAGKPS